GLSGASSKGSCSAPPACSATGNYQTALDHAGRWLGLDPLQEAAHQLIMQLYAQTGDRSAAIRQYRECLRTLEQELGVKPLDETTGVYQAILAGEVAGHAPRRGVARVPRACR